MKTYEAIQRANDGGSPTPNDGPFSHGDTILMVHKRDLLSLLYRCRDMMDRESKPSSVDGAYQVWRDTMREIEEILTEDGYFSREPDLPAVSFNQYMESRLGMGDYPQGWGTLSASETPHYFREGKSICKRWIFWGAVSADVPNSPCKECVKKLIKLSKLDKKPVKKETL